MLTLLLLKHILGLAKNHIQYCQKYNEGITPSGRCRRLELVQRGNQQPYVLNTQLFYSNVVVFSIQYSTCILNYINSTMHTISVFCGHIAIAVHIFVYKRYMSLKLNQSAHHRNLSNFVYAPPNCYSHHQLGLLSR